jgi:hypothetical protein
LGKVRLAAMKAFLEDYDKGLNEKRYIAGFSIIFSINIHLYQKQKSFFLPKMSQPSFHSRKSFLMH